MPRPPRLPKRMVSECFRNDGLPKAKYATKEKAEARVLPGQQAYACAIHGWHIGTHAPAALTEGIPWDRL